MINAAPIAMISGTLKDETEKPSTRFFVKSGTTSPASVVMILAVNPMISIAFGIFVDKIRLKKGLRPFGCFSITSNPNHYVHINLKPTYPFYCKLIKQPNLGTNLGTVPRRTSVLKCYKQFKAKERSELFVDEIII